MYIYGLFIWIGQVGFCGDRMLGNDDVSTLIVRQLWVVIMVEGEGHQSWFGNLLCWPVELFVLMLFNCIGFAYETFHITDERILWMQAILPE